MRGHRQAQARTNARHQASDEGRQQPLPNALRSGYAAVVPDLPNLAYYRANHGRWRSPFAFAITDWRAFRAAPMTRLERWKLRLIACVPKLVGPLEFDTTMDCETARERGQVLHTTRLSKWGISLYRAAEVFTLNPNGTDVLITREERSWPTFRRARESGQSRGAVDPTGAVATYVFPFFGTLMKQTVTIEANGVRVVQETDWSRGEQLLVRESTTSKHSPTQSTR